MAKEKWTAGNIKQEYLRNIQATKDSSILTIKTLFVAYDNINYKKTMQKLLKTVLHSNFDQDKHQRGHSRRLPHHSKGNIKSYGSIPRVPGHFLDIIRKRKRLQATGLILKWKNICNEKKRHIRSDELRLNDNIDSNHIKNNKGNYKYGKQKVGNHNHDKKGNKNPRK